MTYEFRVKEWDIGTSQLVDSDSWTQSDPMLGQARSNGNPPYYMVLWKLNQWITADISGERKVTKTVTYDIEQAAVDDYGMVITRAGNKWYLYFQDGSLAKEKDEGEAVLSVDVGYTYAWVGLAGKIKAIRIADYKEYEYSGVMDPKHIRCSKDGSLAWFAGEGTNWKIYLYHATEGQKRTWISSNTAWDVTHVWLSVSFDGECCAFAYGTGSLSEVMAIRSDGHKITLSSIGNGDNYVAIDGGGQTVTQTLDGNTTLRIHTINLETQMETDIDNITLPANCNAPLDMTDGAEFALVPCTDGSAYCYDLSTQTSPYNYAIGTIGIYYPLIKQAG